MTPVKTCQKRKTILAFVLFLLSLIMSACNFPPSEVTTQDITVDVVIEPSLIEVNDEYRIVVSVYNRSSKSLPLTDITLHQSLLEGSWLTAVSPTYINYSQVGDSTTFQFDLQIPAKQSIQIEFTLQALSDGDYKGEVLVIAASQTKSTQARIVIGQPPSSIQPSPTGTVIVTGGIPFRAVVQIIAMYEDSGEMYIGWTGSGSIITPDGLILTNAHVVLPDKYFPVDALVVALTLDVNHPPEPTYYAEVVQADPDLDIAVIKITTDLDGNPVDRTMLDLPNVPIGDSDALQLGDNLTILGYPGIGGETITLTRGEVSGFTSDKKYGDRAFIKTSATIAGGNSGGLAANDRGEIIGIPTQLGYGGDDQYVDCRVLADTNRDGVIDDKDNCVPTGGFINALRPIKLALPLTEAAERGEVWIGEVEYGQIVQPSGEGLLFQDDFSNPGSGWDDWMGENGGSYYSNNEYLIEVQTESYLIWGNPSLSFGNVVVTVEAHIVNPTGVGDYGVLCRYQDNNNFYALEVSEDGYYTIWKYERGEFVILVDWEYVEVVPRTGETVTLTIACVGDTLSLAVNSILLAEVQDSSFSHGDVGLIAGTWDQGGLTVAFDDFQVWEPGD
ncbi:MAG: serine protease [Chloroflexota bacterium]